MQVFSHPSASPHGHQDEDGPSDAMRFLGIARVLIDAIECAVLACDIDGRVVFFNHAAGQELRRSTTLQVTDDRLHCDGPGRATLCNAIREAALRGIRRLFWLGADPQRLVLAGDSAGANLAAAVALMAREDGGPQARAQLLFYGSANYPDDMTPSAREFADGPILTGSDVAYFWAQYLRDPQAERDDFRASPYRAPRHDGLPSAFVATAECDPSRDDAERYGRKLADAGVAVQIKRYAGMPHGFVSWLGVVPAAQQAVDDACAFLATRS